MPSAELTSTQAPQEPAAAPNTPHPRSPHTVVSDGEATAQPTAKRSRYPAAFRAIGLWLLRALTDSAGAWALAAGALAYPSSAVATAGGNVTAREEVRRIGSARDALGAEAAVYLGYGAGGPGPGDGRGYTAA